jgi:hypothetical protein
MGWNRTSHEVRQPQSSVPPQAESLVNIYFDLIDEMAAELEQRRVTGTVSLWD